MSAINYNALAAVRDELAHLDFFEDGDCSAEGRSRNGGSRRVQELSAHRLRRHADARDC